MLSQTLMLETKLHPPRLKPNLLVRESLLCLLHRHLDKRLIAVISGAGYGKTTLLGQLLEREQLPAIYLTLDPADSDPVQFARYLLAGLSRLANHPKRSIIDQSLAEELRQLRDQSLLAQRPEDFAVALINALSSHRTGDLYLVLDDYHWLEPGSRVHALMNFCIDRMPAFMHLIICSRTPAPLALMPKWRSKQDVFELDQSDLAFKEADLRSLMVLAYRATLPESELTRMLEQTQGWITGIHLIMQAAGMHKSVKETLNGYVAANRPLFEYFASEILGKEDQATRDFLVRSSILETLSGPACDHLLQRKGSDKLLQDLERRNIFLTEIAPGEFEHHPLFRNYLRDNLTEAERRRTLHARAGEFCKNAGLTEQAIDHFLQASESDQAASLLVGVHDHYIGAARFETLGRWLSQLPEDAYVRHPQLLLPLSRWQLEQRLPVEQRQTLQQAADRLEKSDDRSHLCRVLLSLAQTQIADRRLDDAIATIRRGIRLCPQPLAQLRSELHNVCGQAWLWKGCYAKAGQWYRKALQIARSSRLPLSGQVKILVDICILKSRLGDYRTAHQEYRRLISRLPADYYYLGIGSLYGSAAKAALNVGDPLTAEAYLARGEKVCRRHADIRSLTVLSIIRSQLDFFHGRWEQAEAALKDLSLSCERLGSREYAEAVQRNLAQLCRYRGRPAEAWLILERFGQAFDQPPDNYMALRGLSEKGFLEAASGNSGAAKKTAKMMADGAVRLGDRLGEYYAEMIYALSESSRPASAGRHVRLAAAMAKRWGYEGLLALEIANNSSLQDIYRQLPRNRKIDALLGMQTDKGEKPASGRRLLVRLFGQTEFQGTARPAMTVAWKMRIIGALFGYLAVNRERTCHVEELLQALWPRAGLKKAKAQLYQAVCLLREDLRSALNRVGLPKAAPGELVLRQSQGYRLSPELEIELDTEKFDRLWRENIQFTGAKDPTLADRCRQALELYRNGFLPAAGDPWSEGQREQYYKKYLMIKEKLGRHLAAAGQPQSAAVVFEEYLKQEPFAESVRLEYWKALLAVGNRKQLVADQQNYFRLLRRELGQTPGPELTAFLRSLNSRLQA